MIKNISRAFRISIIFILIAIVHAASTFALTNYYQKKVASIYVNTISEYLDSGNEVDFKESNKKVLEQTEHLGSILSFLYMPTWPIWTVLSNFSTNDINFDEITYQQQKEKSKNIFLLFIILNSITFSACLWLCYKIVRVIKSRMRQQNTQQLH